MSGGAESLFKLRRNGKERGRPKVMLLKDRESGSEGAGKARVIPGPVLAPTLFQWKHPVHSARALARESILGAVESSTVGAVCKVMVGGLRR